MEEDSRRQALMRAAAHAYEAAHGNALPEPARGLRWSIQPRVAVTVLFALVIVVALAVFMTTRLPAASPVEPLPAASEADPLFTAGVITVHVVGAVAAPGVYELPPGSRVADGVAAAGGARSDADLTGINLARVVADGEQIIVAVAGEHAAGGSATASGLLNLNSAEAAELEALPGIGPVLAERIVSDRRDRGPFRTIDDLDRVSGVGPAVLQRVRGLLTV